MDHKPKIPISINCVCRNEGFVLESAIDSVAPYVKEIIFVDHYSFDNTLDIAKQLEQRYDNFTILEKVPNVIMNFTDVRELARSHSNCDYVMKYDGDFILTDYKLLEKYLNILISSETIIGISFSVNDLFRDINHIITRLGCEPYIFKKNAIHFYNNGKYADAYKIIQKGVILNEKLSPILHINNAKPILNILYRSRMTEYAVQDSFKGNYFEWLYFINNNRIPNREEFVNAIIIYLRHECTHRLDSDKSTITAITNDINTMLHNTQISHIKIIEKENGYYYDTTIILQYKNTVYFYPDDMNSKKLINVLFEMYDDDIFNNFQ